MHSVHGLSGLNYRALFYLQQNTLHGQLRCQGSSYLVFLNDGPRVEWRRCAPAAFLRARRLSLDRYSAVLPLLRAPVVTLGYVLTTFTCQAH